MVNEFDIKFASVAVYRIIPGQIEGTNVF